MEGSAPSSRTGAGVPQGHFASKEGPWHPGYSPVPAVAGWLPYAARSLAAVSGSLASARGTLGGGGTESCGEGYY